MSEPRIIVDCYPQEANPYANTTADELARLVADAPRILAGEDIYQGWPLPEPIEADLPAVPQFDLGLLPEALRPLVEDVSERMQTPADFAAIIAILSLAGVTGRRARIQPKEQDASWIVVPNLWGGIVAEPGCLKSPLIAAVTKPLAMIGDHWRVEYESSLANYESEKEKQELRQGAWKQLCTAAFKKGAEPPVRPDDSIAEPKLRRLTAQGCYS